MLLSDLFAQQITGWTVVQAMC